MITPISYTDEDKNEILAYWVEQMMEVGYIHCPIPGSIKQGSCVGTGKWCRPLFPRIRRCPCYTTLFSHEFIVDTFWEGLI